MKRLPDNRSQPRTRVQKVDLRLALMKRLASAPELRRVVEPTTLRKSEAAAPPAPAHLEQNTLAKIVTDTFSPLVTQATRNTEAVLEIAVGVDKRVTALEGEVARLQTGQIVKGRQQ